MAREDHSGQNRLRPLSAVSAAFLDNYAFLKRFLARFFSDYRNPNPTGCIANPEVPAYLFCPSYLRHDLSASYDMTLQSGATLNMYAGVRNLFDKDPFVPRTGDAYEGGIGNYDSKFGGGIGRYVYAGVEMRFDD